MRACPIPACLRQARPLQLLCKEHWFLVPKPLRDAVWLAWKRRRSGRGGAVQEHEAAKREAIAAATAAGEPPQKELAL